MVNFKKHLVGKVTLKPTDPLALYDTLDRQHDKGPLRPAQEAILKAWYQNQAKLRDVVIKLHTGQGKTLIGLLMLQSRLNDLLPSVLTTASRSLGVVLHYVSIIR